VRAHHAAAATPATRPGPIGLFDSGIGGLTVVRELVEQLPSEGVVYFGDTARLPYGTKSAATVTRFSIENTHFLMNQGVRMVVVACNTSSAVALDTLKRHFDVPILGVVEPGARAAVRATRNGRVGIIGTVATIESRSYHQAIAALEGGIEVHGVACPLFVPLAEEGWTDHPVTVKVAQEYLAPLEDAGVDTLVLGCTHYPVLAGAIRAALGEHVVLVDSAAEVVRDVCAEIGDDARTETGVGEVRTPRTDTAQPTADDPEQPSSDRTAPLRRFCVSDIPRRFREVGSRFLGAALDEVLLVDQTDLPWFERSPDHRTSEPLEPIP
jgi:glutamate racemase